MTLPISIENLLEQYRVESNRVEFKESWNDVTIGAIFRTICAFANDFDNLGGGYVIIGAAEREGVISTPIRGIEEHQLDHIQKRIVELSRQMTPFYQPKIYVEQIKGRYVIVLWAPAGEQRPYRIYPNVADKKKEKRGEKKYYIRNASITEEAKGDKYNELMSLKNRIPFDERGNPQIKPEDISMALVRDHLVKVGSRLTVTNQRVEDILENMGLMTGPSECRLIKNVAAMMFCDNPEKFFPCTRAEIVIFPDGREQNPSNMEEIPAITGPVPLIITKTLDFLRTHVVKETIRKVSHQAEALRTFNYPYDALEEAIVNAFYHRDYQVHEPVEIAVEPDCIRILSFSGPDRSISMAALREAKSLNSRRYRNRRLGEFLKELDLTEGRATGIPTIQAALKKNGSPKASIVTDEDRTSFRIDIPHYNSIANQSEPTQLPILEQMFRKALSLGKISMKIPHRETMLLMLQTLHITSQPLSLTEISNQLEGISKQVARRSIISPLIELGLLEMVIPNVPNSSKQKYIASLAASVFFSEQSDE